MGTSERRTEAADALPGWKLEDAKARSSELVRLARERGPQRVTVRGQDAVVVSAEDYVRLAAVTGLAALFGEGPLARLDDFDDAVTRERVPHRDATDFASDAG